MKIDIKNPDNYQYKAVDLCYNKGCQFPAEWWILDDTFGFCDKCFKRIGDEK